LRRRNDRRRDCRKSDTMNTRLHRDLTVQTVLDVWPSTRAVFIARRMACVGCDMAPFMTIAEAAASYNIGVDDLERELRAAAATSASPS
jgi:hybrid cluster-associated redox disulfide protein